MQVRGELVKKKVKSGIKKKERGRRVHAKKKKVVKLKEKR